MKTTDLKSGEYHGFQQLIHGFCCSLVNRRMQGKQIHDLDGQTTVILFGHREITMTAAGFNVKTTYFVRNHILFFGLSLDLINTTNVFVLACRSFFDRFCHVGNRQLNPSGRTDVVNMETTQHGRYIALKQLQ